MRTAVSAMFAVDSPSFAFSHCRDVVAAVTNAGGMGGLGAAAHTPEHLEHELAWIDSQVGGKPYGDAAPVAKTNLLAAASKDAVRSRAITGKPCRQLRTAWTEAFDDPDSPGALPMPLQSLLFAPANDRIKAAGIRALAGEAVGQIVGRMTAERRAADVYVDLIRDSLDTVERLHAAFIT